MGRLNSLLAADHGGERFMTMHLCMIDARAANVRSVNAGHDPVIVFDPADQTFSEFSEGDMPLGIMAETEYREEVLPAIRPGQVFFFGTDGVWEMPDVSGALFGKDRLRDAIRAAGSGSADEIVARVRQDLIAFRGDAKSVDDVTFVVVKVLSK